MNNGDINFTSIDGDVNFTSVDGDVNFTSVDILSIKHIAKNKNDLINIPKFCFNLAVY